jgi:hypothetical protein
MHYLTSHPLILNTFYLVSSNLAQETKSEEHHITMNGEHENTAREPEPLVNGDLIEPPVNKQGKEKLY